MELRWNSLHLRSLPESAAQKLPKINGVSVQQLLFIITDFCKQLHFTLGRVGYDGFCDPTSLWDSRWHTGQNHHLNAVINVDLESLPSWHWTIVGLGNAK